MSLVPKEDLKDPTTDARVLLVPMAASLADYPARLLEGTILQRLAQAELAEEPVAIPLTDDELIFLTQNIETIALTPALLLELPDTSYSPLFLAQQRFYHTVSYEHYAQTRSRVKKEFTKKRPSWSKDAAPEQAEDDVDAAIPSSDTTAEDL